jgi:RNA polymerase sigma factor (sigma-70 family)
MSDDLSHLPERLEAIVTRWSLLRRAHDDDNQDAVAARQALVTRYATAVRSYVRAIMQGSADADEVAQDVVVKMMQGNFAGADPERGRFRDLLKVAVRNLVKNRWARENRRQGVDYDTELVAGPDEEGGDDPWETAWRTQVLDNAWAALEDYERSTAGAVPYTLLRLRAKYPDAESDELAKKLGEKLGRSVRADAVRQQLRRARVRFAELLLDEVADGLDQASPDRIEEELIALGLFEHVRDLLPADWKTKRAGG